MALFKRDGFNYRERREIVSGFYSHIALAVESATKKTKEQLKDGKLETQAYIAAAKSLDSIASEIKANFAKLDPSKPYKEKELTELKGIEKIVCEKMYELTQEDHCLRLFKSTFDENLYESLSTIFTVSLSYGEKKVAFLSRVVTGNGRKIIGGPLFDSKFLNKKFRVPASICNYGEPIEGLVFSALINSLDSKRVILDAAVALDDSRINPNKEVYVRVPASNGQRAFGVGIYPCDIKNPKYIQL